MRLGKLRHFAYWMCVGIVPPVPKQPVPILRIGRPSIQEHPSPFRTFACESPRLAEASLRGTRKSCQELIANLPRSPRARVSSCAACARDR